MRLPVIQGIIKRRMLVNFRVEPAVIQALLPLPFQPKLHHGYAIAGICLIRLEQIRPAGFPAALGLASENAAHRIAVTWDVPSGEQREGVFIPRRDTSSRLNHFAGGRIFPGEHHLADFKVNDDGQRVALDMHSRDGEAGVCMEGSATTTLPDSSCFASMDQSSEFFRGGSLGYSVTHHPGRLDGLLLQTKEWRVQALRVERVESSFFSNFALFPAGTAHFDHALIMRDIPHEWHQAEDMFCGASSPREPSVAAR